MVPVVVEKKKKKGKRRNQELAVQEGVESDDTTSMSALNVGGEDSQDPLDNAVSGQNKCLFSLFDWIIFLVSNVVTRKRVHLQKMCIISDLINNVP